MVATIEARMGSSRLPGKVLKPLGGRPALQRLLERVGRAQYVDEIVVATTTEAHDIQIADLCTQLGVKCFRGSEEDVLDRVLQAAKSVEATHICELMGDSPLLDPVLIDDAITAHLAGDYDYTSNFWPENTFPMGFAVQVFPVTTLERVADLTDDPVDHVHVTCFIYQNPQLFRIQGVTADEQVAATDIRLCLDTQDDYELITRVYDALHREGEMFYLRDMVDYLRAHPELLSINVAVRQKAIEEG